MDNQLIKSSLNGLSEKKSYGGRTFSENLDRTEHAIASVKYTENIWNKSRSQFMLKFLTCSQADPYMRLRQISAEMASKRLAYNEAKFNYMKKLTEAELKREDIDATESKTQKKLLAIEAAELEWQASEIMIKFEGAMKELETLSAMHDSLLKQMNNVSETEFEKGQVKAHIKRAVMQSCRNVREYGVIKEGNQEYLEQCGVSVVSAFKEIQEYLKQEEGQKCMNTSMLHQFLNAFADRYADAAKVQADWLGFQLSAKNELTYEGE